MCAEGDGAGGSSSSSARRPRPSDDVSSASYLLGGILPDPAHPATSHASASSGSCSFVEHADGFYDDVSVTTTDCSSVELIPAVSAVDADGSLDDSASSAGDAEHAAAAAAPRFAPGLLQPPSPVDAALLAEAEQEVAAPAMSAPAAPSSSPCRSCHTIAHASDIPMMDEAGDVTDLMMHTFEASEIVEDEEAAAAAGGGGGAAVVADDACAEENEAYGDDSCDCSLPPSPSPSPSPMPLLAPLRLVPASSATTTTTTATTATVTAAPAAAATTYEEAFARGCFNAPHPPPPSSQSGTQTSLMWDVEVRDLRHALAQERDKSLDLQWRLERALHDSYRLRERETDRVAADASAAAAAAAGEAAAEDEEASAVAMLHGTIERLHDELGAVRADLEAADEDKGRMAARCEAMEALYEGVLRDLEDGGVGRSGVGASQLEARLLLSSSKVEDDEGEETGGAAVEAAPCSPSPSSSSSSCVPGEQNEQERRLEDDKAELLLELEAVYGQLRAAGLEVWRLTEEAKKSGSGGARGSSSSSSTATQTNGDGARWRPSASPPRAPAAQVAAAAAQTEPSWDDALRAARAAAEAAVASAAEREERLSGEVCVLSATVEDVTLALSEATDKLRAAGAAEEAAGAEVRRVTDLLATADARVRKLEKAVGAREEEAAASRPAYKLGARVVRMLPAHLAAGVASSGGRGRAAEAAAKAAAGLVECALASHREVLAQVSGCQRIYASVTGAEFPMRGGGGCNEQHAASSCAACGPPFPSAAAAAGEPSPAQVAGFLRAFREAVEGVVAEKRASRVVLPAHAFNREVSRASTGAGRALKKVGQLKASFAKNMYIVRSSDADELAVVSSLLDGVLTQLAAILDEVPGRERLSIGCAAAQPKQSDDAAAPRQPKRSHSAGSGTRGALREMSANTVAAGRRGGGAAAVVKRPKRAVSAGGSSSGVGGGGGGGGGGSREGITPSHRIAECPVLSVRGSSADAGAITPPSLSPYRRAPFLIY